jgi:hypothetical protein
MRRLKVAGVVFAGQVVGGICISQVLAFVGAASQLLHLPRAPFVVSLLWWVIAVTGPLFCSWACLKYSALHPRPLVVCIISTLASGGVFILVLVSAHDAADDTLFFHFVMALIIPPLAGILGSILGSYIEPQAESR